MWLSGKASPSQGEDRGFESRHPLQLILWWTDFHTLMLK